MTTATAPLPRLRERQREALDWVTAYLLEHGQAPTYKEVGEGIYCTAPNAYLLVRSLIQAGYLQRRFPQPHHRRNLELAPRYRDTISA